MIESAFDLCLTRVERSLTAVRRISSSVFGQNEVFVGLQNIITTSTLKISLRVQTPTTNSNLWCCVQPKRCIVVYFDSSVPQRVHKPISKVKRNLTLLFLSKETWLVQYLVFKTIG